MTTLVGELLRVPGWDLRPGDRLVVYGVEGTRLLRLMDVRLVPEDPSRVLIEFESGGAVFIRGERDWWVVR